MATKIISKRSDAAVQKIRDVRDRTNRSLIFCEGVKLAEEVMNSPWQPVEMYCSADLESAAKSLLAKKQNTASLRVLADSVMSFCSDLSTPPGLIVLARAPKEPPAVPSDRAPLVLVIHSLQLPQNAGALLRTAEAAGVSEIYVTARTVDLWGPKALRAAAGSTFRLKIHPTMELPAVIERLKTHGVRCYAAMQTGGTRYDQIPWREPAALVMGSEGAGFSADERNYFDGTLQIPMLGNVESLNVGVAAAVCLFEAARQRRSDAA